MSHGAIAPGRTMPLPPRPMEGADDGPRHPVPLPWVTPLLAALLCGLAAAWPALTPGLSLGPHGRQAALAFVLYSTGLAVLVVLPAVVVDRLLPRWPRYLTWPAACMVAGAAVLFVLISLPGPLVAAGLAAHTARLPSISVVGLATLRAMALMVVISLATGATHHIVWRALATGLAFEVLSAELCVSLLTWSAPGPSVHAAIEFAWARFSLLEMYPFCVAAGLAVASSLARARAVARRGHPPLVAPRRPIRHRIAVALAVLLLSGLAGRRVGPLLLRYAVTDGSRPRAELLLACGVSPNAYAGTETDRVLDVAVRSGDLNLVRTLLDHGADPNVAGREPGSVPLGTAVFEGNADIVHLLIERGANPHARPPGGGPRGHNCTLLTRACTGDSPDVGVVRALIEAGVDVDRETPCGRTTLSYASVYADTDIVTALIDAGAEVNSTDRDQLTPLHYATMASRGDDIELDRIVEALVSAGADVNAQTPWGGSPLSNAARRGRRNAVRTLLAAGAKVNHQDQRGETALYVALLEGRTGPVDDLLAAGADPNLATGKGYTPLHRAASGDCVDAIAMLIDAGADLDAQDQNGQTPLHWAVRRNRPSAVAALMAGGADASLGDVNDESPVMQAKARNMTGVLAAMGIEAL